MKNKYQRLNREEKKEARLKFYKSEFGKNMKPILNRLLIIAILLIIYALYLIIEGIIKHSSIFNYVAAILVLTCALVFLIGRHKVIIRDVNDYIIKKK